MLNNVRTDINLSYFQFWSILYELGANNDQTGLPLN